MEICVSLACLDVSLVFSRFIPTTVALVPVSRRPSRSSPRASSRTAISRAQPPPPPPVPPRARFRGTRARSHASLPAHPEPKAQPRSQTLPSITCFGSASSFGPSLVFRLQRHYFYVGFFFFFFLKV